MTTTLLERGTKPFIILSMLAVGALTVTTAIDWPSLRWVSLVALVGSFLAARWFRTAVIVVQGWLAITYLAPGLLALGLGGFRAWDLTPWFAGLIGAMLATVDPTRWHLPEPWRAPLVAWVLIVAASWPVVWLRELDFAPSVVGATNVNNGPGVPTGIVHLWVYGVVLTHGLGLLWLDWLCATFPRRDVAGFQRVVLTPLAVGWGLATVVAAYQSVVDIGFVNPGYWGVLRRASGTLMDANPFGMLAALWGAIGVAMVLGRRRPSSRRASVALAGFASLVLAASWYGVWVSGSRSALLAGAIVFIFALRWMPPLAVRTLGGRVTAVGLVAAVGLVVALLTGGALLATGSSVIGPWQRLARTLPTASLASMRAFGVELLWDRNWYGTAAVRMIADSPLVGVGVGAFHILVPDVAYQRSIATGHDRLRPDNAQNWFRHQLAEFGVVGSLGWILWVAMFLWLLAVGRPVDGGAARAGLVRGALVALGLASLVGMPTLNTALALTFWTLVFWYLLLVEPSSARAVPRWVGGGALWAGIWVLALAYVGGLAYVSWSDLRVPLRAQRADWDYSYGFHAPETDESGDEFRWASGGRALAVVPVQDRWIELSAWTHHPDVREDPVELKVWLDGTLLLDTQREGGEPITRAMPVPEGQQRVLIETWVNRTWRPIDYGKEDTRELGAGVRWRFIDR